MSKDQTIGAAILLVCAVVGVLYTLGLFYWGYWTAGRSWALSFTLVALPMFVAFIAIIGIGAWIGWTMATTPPLKPIEEITSADETKPAENKEP